MNDCTTSNDANAKPVSPSIDKANGAVCSINAGKESDDEKFECILCDNSEHGNLPSDSLGVIKGKHDRSSCMVIEDGEVIAHPASQPKLPCSKDEIEMHNLTHHPFRRWCPFCVVGKCDNVARKRGEVKRDCPVISIDYMFLNKASELQADESSKFQPILVSHDSESSAVSS